MGLTGCFGSDDIKKDLDEYRVRLARVLDIQIPQHSAITELPLPAAGQLRTDIPAFILPMRDFYAIQHCELGSLVAQQNTAIGKTALPSQRLRYEMALVNTLDACINSIHTTHPALAEQLQQWKHVKVQQRPHVWANMIQTSEEMRLALSLSPEFLDAQHNQDAGASIAALAFLTQLRNSSLSDSANIEPQLQVLQSSRLPAKIWRTQALIAQQLNALTSAIAAHSATLPCPEGKASEQVTILRNVFYRYFIEKVQPVGSQLNRYHYLLNPTWESWLTDDALHPAFKNYIRTHSVEGFAAYQHAIDVHVKLWQQLLKRCNLSPVAPISAG